MRERPQDYGALARERLMAGAFVRAADYVNATRVRRKMTDAFHALFADIDVAVTASSMDPACRIDDPKAVEHTYAPAGARAVQRDRQPGAVGAGRVQQGGAAARRCRSSASRSARR